MSADTSSPTDRPPPTPVRDQAIDHQPRDTNPAIESPDRPDVGPHGSEPEPEFEAFLADKHADVDSAPNVGHAVEDGDADTSVEVDDSGRAADAGDIDEIAEWPETPSEMDELLGVQGTEIPDLPETPDRNKVRWDLPDGTKVTYEQHPYHEDGPTWHREPHWHYDKPGQQPHQRALPGDAFDLLED